MPTAGPSPIRVLYRHYGGENTKPRPDYYSKTLALASLLRAAEELDHAPELVFVNDQVRPGRLLTLMESSGEVVDIRGGSDRRSLRTTFSREAARATPLDTFLWFAEDDYLYRPDALRRLAEGAAGLPQADYLTVYGSGALDVAASRRRVVEQDQPGAGAAAVSLHGLDWYPAAYATSTFGLRVGTLREDLRLLRFCALSGGAWDQTSWMVAGGYLPFTAAELGVDLFPFRSTPPSGWPRALARGSIRLAASARSLRRPSRRRTLFASDPELVHHMEAPIPGARHELSTRTAAVDWSTVAAETAAWAQDRGIDVAPEGRA
ncbi:hypothetical protein [Modestobacter sp. Leaf380]|uniref:hypothetical protein n=1 Tax=Modestobacter sp. Leaf380 TaxID=1736356 RepID=UPI0006F48CAF|nr:hypothetical protein [Modestobacter sp. Leaf380]KQS63556.1 hypothetical protein ASG41_18015 [Modestobacter sp. Leaf380]